MSIQNNVCYEHDMQTDRGLMWVEVASQLMCHMRTLLNMILMCPLPLVGFPATGYMVNPINQNMKPCFGNNPCPSLYSLASMKMKISLKRESCLVIRVGAGDEKWLYV